ncbi:uncharacterized protein LOC129317371 [Prosopis cineraria]|uniref:uncharacterized protein LOC129317371 n=1 Tax=Prosopis cineraria TaxID=364024 RepID=UPI00240F17B0|nr:uncharacterized protein LOC129317371 [Prosopis cineraria]
MTSPPCEAPDQTCRVSLSAEHEMASDWSTVENQFIYATRASKDNQMSNMMANSSLTYQFPIHQHQSFGLSHQFIQLSTPPNKRRTLLFKENIEEGAIARSQIVQMDIILPLSQGNSWTRTCRCEICDNSYGSKKGKN